MAKKKPAKPAATAESLTLPVSRAASAKCAGQHFGAWAVEPKWFKSAVDAVRNGTWQPRADLWDGEDDGDDDCPLYEVVDGIAVITMDGQMTKRGSSFGGCSTVMTREALRTARADWMVRGVVLHITSPGGTVAGTADLADEVRATRREKPVVAFVSDLCCSAAYWVASQCESIAANVTALVGSIGTYAVLEDDTGMQEQVGVKYRVVSTGEYKGLGADGTVTDKMVADVQREVNELNQPFLAAVQSGRGAKITNIADVSDGRAHVAQQALSLGLIDEVSALDAVLAAISQRTSRMNADAFKAYAAEHPEAVAGYIEQGYNQAKGDLKPKAATVADLRAAFPGEDAFVLAQLEAGATLAQANGEAVKMYRERLAAADAKVTEANAAKDKAVAEKDKEIDRLKVEAGTQAAVGTSGAATAASKQADKTERPDRPETRDQAELDRWAKAAAAWDWDNEAEPKQRYSTKDRYVAIRSRELLGQHKVLTKSK